MLYFPSLWYHEVHNLSEESVAITNASFNHMFIPLINLNETDHDVLKGIVQSFITLVG